jgi:hypothetical protein
MDMFLSKPFQLDELSKVLNDCVRKLGIGREFKRGTRSKIPSSSTERSNDESLRHSQPNPRWISIHEPVTETRPLELLLGVLIAIAVGLLLAFCVIDLS